MELYNCPAAVQNLGAAAMQLARAWSDSVLKYRFSTRFSNPRSSFATNALAMLGALVLSVFCLGQAEAPKAVATDSDVVNVNEVTLDLMVRDKKGRPVSDLKPGDIAVTDGGTPVKISNLRTVTGERGADHMLTLVFDRLNLAASYNAREIAGKILKTIPQDSFSFSVLKTQGGLLSYQDFTSDRSALTHAIYLVTDPDTA